MPSALALHDHRAVQSAVVRTTLAGAGAGLLHALWPGMLTDALAMCLVGIAAVPPRTLRSGAIAAFVACAGAAAFVLPPVAAVALLGACGGALFARDLEAGAPRRLLAGAAGVAALAGGLFVAEGLRLGALVGVPAALAWLAAGGAAGLCAGLGVIGREVTWREALPPSSAAAVALPAAAFVGGAAARGNGAANALGAASTNGAANAFGAASTNGAAHALGGADALGAGNALGATTIEGGELGELLGRAALACRQVEDSLGEEAPAAARAATDLLQRIGAFSLRWRDLDRQLVGLDRDGLIRRAEQMAERARRATDGEVGGEYLRAERALRQQIEDLDAIRGWQERSLARLHHHVAVLERLRLAALHRRSIATGRSGDELSSLVDELSSAGLDLDGAAELLAELPAAS